MRTYRVEVSEAAELEADRIYLWIQRRSTAAAHQWYAGLLRAFDTLTQFPYRCAALPADPETRRLLYGNSWILFRIVEVDETSLTEEMVGDEAPSVRILHIQHAARAFPGDPTDEG
jgi:plasmid stabilization system protein ParE